jgi:hypothetical protein
MSGRQASGGEQGRWHRADGGQYGGHEDGWSSKGDLLGWWVASGGGWISMMGGHTDQDWTKCAFAHPREKVCHSDPSTYHYSGIACPIFHKGQVQARWHLRVPREGRPHLHVLALPHQGQLILVRLVVNGRLWPRRTAMGEPPQCYLRWETLSCWWSTGGCGLGGQPRARLHSVASDERPSPAGGRRAVAA